MTENPDLMGDWSPAEEAAGPGSAAPRDWRAELAKMESSDWFARAHRGRPDPLDDLPSEPPQGGPAPSRAAPFDVAPARPAPFEVTGSSRPSAIQPALFDDPEPAPEPLAARPSDQ
ncbi:MAG: hypothetical protein LBR19_04995, partial [Bifidobacteriaceae bacterium]|nr:hypothetical protein [Bifidobacteriaceae bacterium]